MVATITREELKRKVDSGGGFTLVETLPEFMYQQGHLPGAVNLPPSKVKELAPTLLPDKDADIVVYCGGPT
jgi:rhodanese-related sulfurtransferase